MFMLEVSRQLQQPKDCLSSLTLITPFFMSILMKKFIRPFLQAFLLRTLLWFAGLSSPLNKQAGNKISNLLLFYCLRVSSILCWSSLFIKQKGYSFLAILVYVDDYILALHIGQRWSGSNVVHKDISSWSIQIKDLPSFNFFRGYGVARSKDDINICQHKYFRYNYWWWSSGM